MHFVMFCALHTSPFVPESTLDDRLESEIHQVQGAFKITYFCRLLWADCGRAGGATERALLGMPVLAP